MWLYLTTFIQHVVQRDQYRIQLIRIDAISTQSSRWDDHKRAARPLSFGRVKDFLRFSHSIPFVHVDERETERGCVCVWHFTKQYTLFLVHSTIYLIQVNECRKHTNDKSCDWLLFWESTHTPCLYLTDKTKSFKWFPFRLILPIFIHEEWMIKPKHFVYRNGPSIPDTLLCIF